MGWLGDILQVLPGIQANSVLRERVTLAEQKSRDMEAENKRLEEKVATLTKENDELRQRIQDAPVAVVPPMERPEERNGLLFFNGDSSKPYCPRCHKPHGEKQPMSALTGAGFICPVCECFVPNTVPFPSAQI